MSHPGLPTQLQKGSVHIWWADLRQFSESLDELDNLLVHAERDRAARFVKVEDQRRSLVARGCLRRLLSHYWNDCPPRELSFTLTEYGKPRLVGAGIEFNVSHSGDFVVLAFSSGRAVGVDVERVRTGMDLETLARFCFSPEEVEAVLQAPDRTSAFFQHWTAKESWMKADGRGLSLPITQYTLRPSAGGTAFYRVFDSRNQELDWTTQPMQCAPGYFAAITAAGCNWVVLHGAVGDLIRSIG